MRFTTIHGVLSFIAVGFSLLTGTSTAAKAMFQPETDGNISVETLRVHGNGLEGNLEGDSPDRDVAVFLPPSYARATDRRYPVVYLLPGLMDKVRDWFGPEKHWIKLPDVLSRAMGGGVPEMIVIMPDAYTRYGGSLYSASVTTGDWERFIAEELVSYIDSHYRTLASRGSRGLAGHSMGGYGALRIGMRHPDIFAAMYALNPCCLTPAFAVPQDMASGARIESVKSFDDLAAADLPTKAAFASAAAWSPNPGKPPFFLDPPWRDGVEQPDVIARWTANRPLVMVDQYVSNLRKLRGIGFDAGTRDIPEIHKGVQQLDVQLRAYDIAHRFDIYEGDHQSGVALRLEKVVLPFFGRNLDTDAQSAPENREKSAEDKPDGSPSTSLHQDIDFRAGPKRVFKALTDQRQFAAFTGANAHIPGRAGETYTLFNSLVNGRIIDIIPDQRMVLAWHPTAWPEGVYSIVRIEISF